MIKIFNTLTRKKEKFIPFYSKKINMYVCGVTAYDLCHIGHGRTFIIFDVIVRYLRYCGFNVNYIRNITDIDDKIIFRSIKNNESIWDLTDRMIKEMHIDFDRLNILRPKNEPRATHYINETIKLINKLFLKKHAYIADNGDVMFSVKSYTKYGILSQQKLNELRTQRNFHLKQKHHPMDFVLWKISKPNEPYWSSPWGQGRPGWHIECSAISNREFNGYCDIHGGGSDLIFPHHENELAQSLCSFNDKVNFWMHTGLVTQNNKKISKSMKNLFTIREILQCYNSETVRYFFISSHYRSRINYDEKNLKKSEMALKRLYHSLSDTDQKASPAKNEKFTEKFIEAMNDDFNTPKACSVLFDIMHEINRLKNKCSNTVHELAATLRKLANILGLLNEPNFFLKGNNITGLANKDEIVYLIHKRNEARKNKQWDISDKIRRQLISFGIEVKDDHI